MHASTGNPAPQFQLGVFQFAPRLRDMESNINRMAECARLTSPDLLLTPELSLTGYDLRDDVHRLARLHEPGAHIATAWGEQAQVLADHTLLVGAVDRAPTAVPYNAAVLADHGRLAYVQHKVYLPTYGMFDEGRYFGRGRRVEPFTLKGWRFGVLVCEDFWHPMLAYLQALQGAHVLLVMAAAPGRGAWNGGEDGAFFASTDAWERIARTYAQLYGVYVVVCNRTGVEGAVTFGGESLVVAPDTSVIARAGIDEQLLDVQLSARMLTAARTPYAHIRDEDAALALREIERIMAAL